MYVEVVAKHLSPYPPESHKHNSKHLQALLDLWWGCPKEALISSQQSSKFGACGESRAATRPPCLGCSASRTVGPGNQRQLRMNRRSILIREHPLHFPLKGDWTFEPKLMVRNRSPVSASKPHVEDETSCCTRGHIVRKR